jgi:hypothetical protein
MSKKFINKPDTGQRPPRPVVKEGSKISLPKIVRKIENPTNGTGPKTKK